MRSSPFRDDGRLVRVQLRDRCRACLKEATTAAKSRIFKGNPWPQTIDQLPALWLSAPADSGTSLGAGPPSFSRIATIQAIGIVCGTDPSDALDKIDQFNEDVEYTLLTDTQLLSMVEEVEGVHTRVELNSEAKNHIARFTLALELKYSESFLQTGPQLGRLSGRLTDL